MSVARVSRQDLPSLTRRGAWWGALAAAAVVALLAVLVLARWGPLLRFDLRVDTAIHAWALQHAWAVDVSRVLEAIGRFRVAVWVVVATVILLLVARRWWQAATLVVVASLAPLLTTVLKVLVARERPVWAVPLGTADTFSFPSGHATTGIAVYAACGVALGSLLRNASWGAVVAAAFLLLGVAIGLSRLVLGVHWPSDVLAGWCVALAVAGAAGALLVLPPPPDRP